MPSRDMLVSAVSPVGAAGKAFGFVNMGFGFGGMVSPVIFGLIMDTGFVQGSIMARRCSCFRYSNRIGGR